jgi:peroxiredoxin
MQSPDITLPDVDGHQVSLSSFRGRVALLEFWNSYNTVCSGKCPSDMIGAYRQYHSKGFEIYSVSTDRNKKKWIETIQRDSLVWINVQDTNRYPKSINTTVFGNRATTSNVLIDKDGKILARDITNFQLKELLAELLK